MTTRKHPQLRPALLGATPLLAVALTAYSVPVVFGSHVVRTDTEALSFSVLAAQRICVTLLAVGVLLGVWSTQFRSVVAKAACWSAMLAAIAVSLAPPMNVMTEVAESDATYQKVMARYRAEAPALDAAQRGEAGGEITRRTRLMLSDLNTGLGLPLYNFLATDDAYAAHIKLVLECRDGNQDSCAQRQVELASVHVPPARDLSDITLRLFALPEWLR